MQKKLLLVLTIVGSALVSRAQVEKNDWLLGGYFNFNTSSSSSNNGSNNGSNSGSNSNISPELGWAAGKNSIIGARGSVNFGTSKDVNGYKSTNHSYLVGAFWKKLFPINEKVGWYGDLTGAYSYSNNEFANSSQPQQVSGSGFYAAISPGVYYKAGKKILLNAAIGGMTYNYGKTNYDYTGSSGGQGSSKASTFGINLLNYYSFGVSFILNKEHQM